MKHPEVGRQITKNSPKRWAVPETVVEFSEGKTQWDKPAHVWWSTQLQRNGKYCRTCELPWTLSISSFIMVSAITSGFQHLPYAHMAQYRGWDFCSSPWCPFLQYSSLRKRSFLFNSSMYTSYLESCLHEIYIHNICWIHSC